MLTKEYILECLEEYCILSELSDENFFCSVIEPLQDADCFDNWYYASGVTKGVLIFKELDFVIKIPFEGREEITEEYWESENGTYMGAYTRNEKYTHTPNGWKHFNEECAFYPFHGADCDNHWNYCSVEARICEEAKQANVSSCFAKTYFIGMANGHPIYAQEKCTIYSDEHSSRHDSLYKHRTEHDYQSLGNVRERVDFYDIDDDWVLDFLIYWGEEKLKQLAQFVFDTNITDLHWGNIGYRKGVPVLIDYSSYHD